jgi:DNA-binding NtrC family response regulator
MANILVVDDEPKMTSLVCGQLEDAGHKVTTTTKPAEALALLDKHAYDVVITDLSMPEISGMDLLEKAITKEGTSVLIMTAFGTVESAVEAMKKGAADYLIKPFSLAELQLIVARLIEQEKERSLSKHYRAEIESSVGAEYIDNSAAAKRTREMIEKVAGTDSTVLLTGRSGSGKEIAARMIHRLSTRSRQPFVAVNCAALTETLLESELFGHEKGAFTGAIARKKGRLEIADLGTIFLDEIGEMSAAMQSKLLRVLEERKIVRVGGVDQIDIDCRLIAATNRDLKKEVADGNFREDLYFRLAVFPIALPSLSERVEDIVPLAEYFLRGYAHKRLSNEVKQLLTRYDWPGNIRELRNVIERATILAGGEELTVDDFSLDIDNAPLPESGVSLPSSGNLESAERQMILDALSKAKGNKTDAANLLGITRRRLYSRMKVHRIDP